MRGIKQACQFEVVDFVNRVLIEEVMQHSGLVATF